MGTLFSHLSRVVILYLWSKSPDNFGIKLQFLFPLHIKSINNTNIYVASYYSIRVILLTSCSSFSDFGEAERFPWLLPFISLITVAMATQMKNQHSLIFPTMAKIIKWYENNIVLLLYLLILLNIDCLQHVQDYVR